VDPSASNLKIGKVESFFLVSEDLKGLKTLTFLLLTDAPAQLAQAGSC
jgi:hypothetical protein